MPPVRLAVALALMLFSLVCLVTGHLHGLHGAPDPLCLAGLSLAFFVLAAARRPGSLTARMRGGWTQQPG